ncbi:Mo-dependent nitrogenase C-terminal domain-containing protein [Aetokthonos hydrillicola Thurmond2011]|jgi:hypothetical protein|uniref:Mo-dependent nitrogenase C-terminal domain-containing protein n=1 Tax=Aetokthonos hydrillicola Thurmond2011 TaxID=2712845 RepID=A0AAP5IGQ9_9CYAN|nr:nitrogenase [Aetokthonos hydrillicola CCALA 1050]MBW4589711.1 Mo-dependent nitrogenase C-terminal domain-containing protein [Aetokthonos hydrillicola CCALA 1050]MDR9898965.1 Mo-dependent nitrogenase C-terminal domain-containing protein [Aetokthonos hydrillicola Thurmond2011]
MKPSISVTLITSFRLSFKIQIAQIICRVIPDSCPFEQTFIVGNKAIHIPPLCKLNPFYGALIQVKFKASTFLAEGHYHLK